MFGNGLGLALGALLREALEGLVLGKKAWAVLGRRLVAKLGWWLGIELGRSPELSIVGDVVVHVIGAFVEPTVGA